MAGVFRRRLPPRRRRFSVVATAAAVPYVAELTGATAAASTTSGLDIFDQFIAALNGATAAASTTSGLVWVNKYTAELVGATAAASTTSGLQQFDQFIAMLAGATAAASVPGILERVVPFTGRVEPEGTETYIFIRPLDDIGDGTGETSATGDYSSLSTVFRSDVGEGEFLNVWSLTITITDTGAFNPATYGDLAALSTGITVGIYSPEDEGGAQKHLLTQVTVTAADDWMTQTASSVSGLGPATLVAIMDLTGTSGEGGYSNYRMYPGESIRVTLADDFSGLITHTFTLAGRRISTNV